jgi:hypothetical protein
MQKPDLETLVRSRRVQDLCRELRQLVRLSLEQRRTIDQLLAQLEAVTRRARTGNRPLVRAAGASVASTPGRLSEKQG